MAENQKDDLDVQEPEYEYAYENQDERDSGYYGTGSTTPPKDHAGVVALVLVLLILCSGLLTALGLLDIHPFRQPEPTEPQSSVSFFSVDGTVPQNLEEPGTMEPLPTEKAQGPVCPVDPGTDLQLKPSPEGEDDVEQEGALSWQDVYAKVIPSVVSITSTSNTSTSSGTGVVMSCNGYIITNSHVVENAVKITVLLTDGRLLEATCVGQDAISDLAVLYVDADDLVPAEFGDSSALRVGDEVVAIGDPLGVELRGTMTDGIISAISRDLKIGGKTMTLLQTTAALNSGNSGGPLVNCYGQVVGINTMKIGDYASVSGVEGLGFAIPMTSAKSVVQQLMTNGYVTGRPSLGIKGQMVSNFYQYYYHLPVGLLITEVRDGSSAQKAGMQPGDILLSLNETRVTGVNVLEELLFTMEVGDSVDVTIYRSGREYQVSFTVEEAKG